MSYVENESYKHKLAKELLCKWLEEKKGNGKWIGDGVHIEYPLIQSMKNDNFGNLLGYGYDIGDGNREYYENNTNNFNPTYKQCIENDDIPIAVLDIAVVYKGCIYEGFEVFHTNKVDNIKKEKIKKLTYDTDFKLYEISAEKILCQTTQPEDIYKLCNRII
jgi:hypothetical protein